MVLGGRTIWFDVCFTVSLWPQDGEWIVVGHFEHTYQLADQGEVSCSLDQCRGEEMERTGQFWTCFGDKMCWCLRCGLLSVPQTHELCPISELRGFLLCFSQFSASLSLLSLPTTHSLSFSNVLLNWIFAWPRSFSSFNILHMTNGLPRWSRGKETACQCIRLRRRGFSPQVGMILWNRKWQPTPVFLPGESHGHRSLMGYSP